jgi:hypothetical protein
LIWDANCSLPLTTYGSVCAPPADKIPGVQHSYTAGIGQQYGARMATAQTPSIRGLQQIVYMKLYVQQALNYVFTP